MQNTNNDDLYLCLLFSCPEDPSSAENSTAPWDKFKCEDGTPLDFNRLKYARAHEVCVCDNGAKPICRATNSPATCPDGSMPGRNGHLPAFLEGCQDIEIDIEIVHIDVEKF